MSDMRTDEGRNRAAIENVHAEHRSAEVEQQARSLARYFGTDEENWRDQLPVLVAVEEGRLKAVYLERLTPEFQEGFRNHMANR